MKLWNKLINALYQVEEPIPLRDTNKIALLIVTVFILLLGHLLNFQPMSKVF